jgi:hypothetical protein
VDEFFAASAAAGGGRVMLAVFILVVVAPTQLSFWASRSSPSRTRASTYQLRRRIEDEDAAGSVAVVRGRPGHLRGRKLLLADGERRAECRTSRHATWQRRRARDMAGRRVRFGVWAHVVKAPEHDLLDEMTEFQPAA